MYSLYCTPEYIVSKSPKRYWQRENFEGLPANWHSPELRIKNCTHAGTGARGESKHALTGV